MIIHVLATAHDGGYPHAGCKDVCCLNIWDQPLLHRLPSSIAAVDQKNKKFYLFDITPNIPHISSYFSKAKRVISFPLKCRGTHRI